MKIKDLIVAVKEYPRILQALEETKSELDASQSECIRLLEQLNELEPLADEYYQQSCSKEYAANQERKKTEKLKTMLASFGPTLDSADKLQQFYEDIAPEFDPCSFTLYESALEITGCNYVNNEFPYEDNCGVFDFADGRQLLKYLTALHFQAIKWEVVPGTPYEKATLLEVDTSTPEYRAFEKKLYTQVLCDLGFHGLLPQEQEQQKAKQKEKRKEGAER